MAKKVEYINATNVETLLEAFCPDETSRKNTEAYLVSMRLKRLANALANYKDTVASMADSEARKGLYGYCNDIERLVGSSYDALYKALAKTLVGTTASK